MSKGRVLMVSLLAASLVLITKMPSSVAVSEIQVKKAFIHETLLKCYLAKKMLPEAMKEYQAVLVLKPNDAKMHFDYGNVMFTMQNPRGALPQFQNAARLQPGVPEYQAAVGACAMVLRNYDLAASAYGRAVSLGGNYVKQLQDAQMRLQVQREKVEYDKQMKLQNAERGKIKDDDD
jgi:tetratricopeptide (TPR) repeat protein